MIGGLGRRLRRRLRRPAPHDDVVAPDLDQEVTQEIPVVTDEAAAAPQPRRRKRRPLYHRLLRLRHIAPTPWQRAAFADLPFAVAVLLVLADLASAWTLLALPLAVAVIVKGHDLLAGLLAATPGSQTQNGAAPEGDGAVRKQEG